MIAMRINATLRTSTLAHKIHVTIHHHHFKFNNSQLRHLQPTVSIPRSMRTDTVTVQSVPSKPLSNCEKVRPAAQSNNS